MSFRESNNNQTPFPLSKNNQTPFPLSVGSNRSTLLLALCYLAVD